jgi:hypothetical protein
MKLIDFNRNKKLKELLKKMGTKPNKNYNTVTYLKRHSKKIHFESKDK